MKDADNSHSMSLPPDSQSDRDAEAAKAALAWASQSGKADVLIRRVEVRVGRARRRRGAIATSALAAVVVVAGSLLHSWRSELPALPPLPQPTPTSAVVSVAAKQVLPDGSVVDLKEGAEIQVDARFIHD